MEARPRASTVEDVEDPDDPYTPYRARSGGSSSAGSSNSGTSRTSPSTSQSSSSGTRASQTSGSNHSGRQARSTPSASRMGAGTQSASSSAADAYHASSSSGQHGTFPREGGDEEPLFGGRPFRDSHDPSSSDNPSASPSADKEHLYTLLNVPVDASPEQIKESYRSLAVVLHPDKHKDASRKQAAESRFREVQRAYEILSDPEKRAVYDYFGEEGLKSSWTVSLRGRSRAEMEAEFLRERQRKQAVDAENLIKSKGDFTAHIDATALFAHPGRIPRPKNSFGPPTFADRVNRVNCTQLIGKHGFETQVTNQTSATFSGQMVSRNGMGGGNLVGTIKTHWSPRLFTEITMSFLRPQIITTKGQFTLDQNSFFSWQATLQTLLMPPSFNVTFGQRLSSKSTLTGFTSFRSGTYTLGPWGRDLSANMLFRKEPGAVSVGCTKQVGEGSGWTVQTSVSQVDQNVSFDYAFKVLDGVKVRTGFNMGTGSGISAFTSAERRLTENVRLSLGLNCSLPVGGMTLKVKVNRLGQKILLPILISPGFRSDLVMLLTLVPATTYSLLHYKLLEPRKRKRLENRLTELRRENWDLIQQRKEAALEGLDVLRDQAIKKALSECQSNGLVIVYAMYGKLEAFPSPDTFLSAGGDQDLLQKAEDLWLEEKAQSSSSSASTTNMPQSITQSMQAEDLPYWNVKIPLQALVSKSQLIIPGGKKRSKSNLLGFFDPVMGEKKHLQVVYLFRGKLHQVTVEDSQELAIPMRIHQLHD